MPVAAVVAVVIAIIGSLTVFGVIGLKIWDLTGGGGGGKNPLDDVKPISGMLLAGLGLLAAALLIGRK